MHPSHDWDPTPAEDISAGFVCSRCLTSDRDPAASDPCMVPPITGRCPFELGALLPLPNVGDLRCIREPRHSGAHLIEIPEPTANPDPLTIGDQA